MRNMAVLSNNDRVNDTISVYLYVYVCVNIVVEMLDKSRHSRTGDITVFFLTDL